MRLFPVYSRQDSQSNYTTYYKPCKFHTHALYSTYALPDKEVPVARHFILDTTFQVEYIYLYMQWRLGSTTPAHYNPTP